MRAEDLTLAAGRPRFRLVAPQGSAEVALRLVGAHHVGNALSAAAVALECGATPEGVAAALSAAGPASRWRMEVVDRADGVTVVNDAYNANPESMRAALQALARAGRAARGAPGPCSGRMARAGRRVRRRPRRGRGDRRRAGRGPPRDGRPHRVRARAPVADVAAALDLLRAELEPGDVVLVKASRAVGLDRLADALVQEREPVA